MNQNQFNDDILLTVITPTYNRAHTLPKCYESLCKQFCQDFVWMIIDDGSTDDTEKIVSGWIEKNDIPIIYKKKENGGKASALNIGIDLLKTKYAVCLDSDDFFYEEAVSVALQELQQIDNDKKCCGILALRNNPDGSVMGRVEIPQDMETITAADVFLKLNLNTELICFYKTDFLCKYRFPEFPGEKFVSPAWMQYRITQDYYFKPVYGKYINCEYLKDGLTRNKKKVILKNPRGYTSVKRFSFDLSPFLIQRIKHGIMYDYGCILSRDKKWLSNVNHKILALLLMPMAFVVYIRRKNIKNGK